MIHKRECVVCGKKFATNHHNKCTCSKECARENQRRHANTQIEDTCAVCGKTYTKARYSTRETCSGDCNKSLIRAKKISLAYTEPHESTNSNITAINRKAREMGLTYGQYQALKYKEQTKVQLPAKKRFIIYD